MVKVIRGNVVDKYYTSLTFDSYDEFCCYVSLLDAFNTDGNSRAAVFVNRYGQTAVVRVLTGSAIEQIGTRENYGKLSEAGYRWIYLFDCLLYKDTTGPIIYSRRVDMSWLDLVRRVDDEKFLCEEWYNALYATQFREGFNTVGLPVLRKETINWADTSVEYIVYGVPALSAVVGPFDYGKIDDCVYTIDSYNVVCSPYLHQYFKDGELHAELWIKIGDES